MLGKLSVHMQAGRQQREDGKVGRGLIIAAPSPPEADTVTPYISDIVALSLLLSLHAQHEVLKITGHGAVHGTGPLSDHVQNHLKSSFCPSV